MTEDLNEAEAKLVGCFKMGNPCSFDNPPGKLPLMGDGMFSEGRNIIRAEVVQELLLSPPRVAPGKASKLVLSGASISGKLDLGCAHVIPFLFTECAFDDIPNLNDAKAEFVGFMGCLLPGIDLSRATIDGPLWFNDTTFRGMVRLDNASISGDVDLDGCKIKKGDHHRGKFSFLLQGLRTQGSIYLSKGFESEGGINAEGVSVAGKFACTSAKITNPEGLALILDHSDISFGFHGNGLNLKGSLNAHHANIGCQFSLNDAKISDATKKALRLDHVVIAGSILMARASVKGEVDFHGAEVSCHVKMIKANISSPNAYAVTADQMRVGGILGFQEAEITGSVFLAASHFGSKVIFDGARIAKSSGAAINMDSCTIMNDVQASKNFQCEGALVLRNSIVSGFVTLSDSVFNASDGRAFDGTFLRSSGGLVAERSTFTGLF
ncbi:pentapeptide repeat-containing protein [Nocardiopsis sp. CNR-923]|uniref:pentapeptide repeat-containing protein n=1 Tax=Nocardiopsis sp. CNR-923 TaxID=1904965 RepID=UPI0013010946|nr:pentapeptide repeat-containing protein [Nocardiopsis sp. CNR-923]